MTGAVVSPLSDDTSTAAARALDAFFMFKGALLVSTRYSRSPRTLPPELLLLFAKFEILMVDHIL